ncbi:hypothetical protein QE152_g22899 [Popillia japonica]|uniref:Uncharacterized protein n=1 Tax=Popillia japonica TaxID=7064 RepID=A0AAW1KJF9_POPJA
MEARLPSELSFKGNVAENWALFKQKLENFLIASGKANRPDEVKIAVLLNIIGDQGLSIYNTFEYGTEEDRTKYEYITHLNMEQRRTVQNTRQDQHEGESVDEFTTELKKLASTCEFKEKDVMIRDRLVLGISDKRIQEKLLQSAKEKDVMIRDRLVLGISDKRIQEKLLQSANLELTEAVTICQSMESSTNSQRHIVWTI